VTNGNAREGRLEVYYNETWGTVCDNGFNDIAAKVACNGLGFGYVMYSSAYSIRTILDGSFLAAFLGRYGLYIFKRTGIILSRYRRLIISR